MASCCSLCSLWAEFGTIWERYDPAIGICYRNTFTCYHSPPILLCGCNKTHDVGEFISYKCISSVSGGHEGKVKVPESSVCVMTLCFKAGRSHGRREKGLSIPLYYYKMSLLCFMICSPLKVSSWKHWVMWSVFQFMNFGGHSVYSFFFFWFLLHLVVFLEYGLSILLAP